MRLQAKITYNGVWAVDRLKGPFPEQLFGYRTSVYERLTLCYVHVRAVVWRVVAVLLFPRYHPNPFQQSVYRPRARRFWRVACRKRSRRARRLSALVDQVQRDGALRAGAAMLEQEDALPRS